jgi:hypothetical protein
MSVSFCFPSCVKYPGHYTMVSTTRPVTGAVRRGNVYPLELPFPEGFKVLHSIQYYLDTTYPEIKCSIEFGIN